MAQGFNLSTDQRGRLVLRRAGQEDVVDVRLRRAFPLTHLNRHISLRSSDGKELLLIDNLENLPGADRELIEQTLAGESFVPQIRRVENVDVRFGYQQWKVQTDRGAAEFRVQEREDIRFLADGRFRIKDADGNVYEMPAVAKMDEGSRRAVAALLA